MPAAITTGSNLGRTQEQYDAYWNHWNQVAAQNSLMDAYFNRYSPGGLTAVQRDIVQNQLSKLSPDKYYTRDKAGQFIEGKQGDPTGSQQIDFLLNMYGLTKDPKGNYVSKFYAGSPKFGDDPVNLSLFTNMWNEVNHSMVNPLAPISTTPIPTPNTNPIQPATNAVGLAPAGTTVPMGNDIPPVKTLNPNAANSQQNNLSQKISSMFTGGGETSLRNQSRANPVFPNYKQNGSASMRSMFDY